MQRTTFDVVVIGGGVMGLATAYHLAREGKTVLLFDQFKIAHDQGQSYGESRMFSVTYGEVEYAKLALQSKELWHELEMMAAEKILFRAGGIDVGEGEKECTSILEVSNTMQALGIDHEIWEYRTLRQKLPVWRLQENSLALYSPADAVIRPTHTVITLFEQARRFGAVIRDQEQVTKIFSGAPRFGVVTAKGRYLAKNLIVTCGVWTNQVLAYLNFSLPIQSTKEQTVYFRPKANATALVFGVLPMWYHRQEPVAYGFPIFGEPGLKVGFHRDGMKVGIDEYDGAPRASVTERLRAYLDRCLSDAAGESFGERTCLYDQTPDDDFIVGQIPGIPNVFVGVGFSGHGFGPAIAIGRALADLVLHGSTEISIGRFNLGRFLEKK